MTTIRRLHDYVAASPHGDQLGSTPILACLCAEAAAAAAAERNFLSPHPSPRVHHVAAILIEVFSISYVTVCNSSEK